MDYLIKTVEIRPTPSAYLFGRPSIQQIITMATIANTNSVFILPAEQKTIVNTGVLAKRQLEDLNYNYY